MQTDKMAQKITRCFEHHGVCLEHQNEEWPCDRLIEAIEVLEAAWSQGFDAAVGRAATQAQERARKPAKRMTAQSLGLRPVDADKAVEKAQVLAFQRVKLCPDCSGAGEVERDHIADRVLICSTCNGTGHVR